MSRKTILVAAAVLAAWTQVATAEASTESPTAASGWRLIIFGWELWPADYARSLFSWGADWP